MEWSFDISFTKEEMDTLEKTWLEFLNQEEPIIYEPSGGWKILSIDLLKWNAAKVSAEIIEYEDMEDNSL